MTPQKRSRTRTLRVALLAICSLAGPWTGVARATELDPTEVGRAISAEVERQVGELEALAPTPLGLVPLTRLHGMRRWVPGHGLAEVYARTASRADADPLVAALAGYRAAVAESMGGRLASATPSLEAQGYLTRWSAAGPFANDGMAGFDRDFGPEQARDPAATYVARTGEVGWVDLSALSRLGYVDLGAVLRPAHSAVGYAATTVTVPRRTSARLWTAVDGAFKVWVNGELVARVDSDLGGGPLREWWDIELERGANELVVKVGVETGAMGFTLRLTDRDGAPIAGLESSADLRTRPEPLAEGAARAPAGSVVQTLVALAAGHEDLAQPRPRALAGMALVARDLQGRDPSEPWRTFTSEPGVCEGAGDGVALHLCSAALSDFWLRYEAAEAAVDALDRDDPAWPSAMLSRALLASAVVGRAGDDTAIATLAELLEVAPDFVPAMLLLARQYDRQRLEWSNDELVARALALAPSCPEVVERAEQVAGDMGDFPAQRALLGRLVTLDVQREDAWLSLLPALARAGEEEALWEAAALARDDYPASLPLLWLEAQLREGHGHLDEALALYQRATELVPGEAEAWEQLGRFALRQADDDEAIAEAVVALRRALAITPQNADLAAYLDELEREGAEFYAAYRYGVDELRALAEEPPPGAEERDYYFVVDQEVVRVHENGLATRFRQRAYRVQTRNGAELLRELQIEYTPDDQIVSILAARVIKPDGSIQEARGERERSLSQPWYGLYYDLAARLVGFRDIAPGDLVELTYTIADVSSRNIFDDYYGDLWYVQAEEPKREASYTVLYPAAMHLTLRPPALPHEATAQEADADGAPENLVRYVLRDVPRVESEAMRPGYTSIADYVHLSTFRTWEAVGAWYWNLIEDQLVASPEIQAIVAQVTQGLTTTRERVAAIHEYVVRNTRYVGLEFGIHGYRPYRTTEVVARRFGDCKDTASLMLVMLRIAGIDAQIVLVRTRDLGALEESPASLSAFNHAITYVPELDLYLDGTAGHAGLDELPAGDQGASVLRVDPDGASVFTTIPFLDAAVNHAAYESSLDLAADPQRGRLLATYRGQFAPSVRRQFDSGDQREDEFQRHMAERLPGARVESVRFDGIDDIKRPVTIEAEVSGFSWLRATSRGWTMLPTGQELDFLVRFAGSAERTLPLLLPNPFRITWAQRYRLPAGLEVVEMPEDVAVSGPFGAYSMQVRREGETLVVDAEVVVTAALVEPGDYGAFRAFLQELEQVFNRPLRLETSGGAALEVPHG
jgi:transglutaminase-like putative cysteine protease